MTYIKHTWVTGEIITAEKLNNMENGIESGGGSGSTGLSDEAKAALLNCFAHVAWTDEHGQDYYDALAGALYPITSISAVYTQGGTVWDDDTLDSLRSDLVVTALYSDSSTQVVTTYTLSGTLEAGTSTITVSYGGKTTTFTVTVSASQSVEYIKQNYSKTASSSHEDYEITDIDFSNGDYVEVSYTQGSGTAEMSPFRLGFENSSNVLWTYNSSYKWIIYQKQAGLSQVVAVYNSTAAPHSGLESTYTGTSHVVRFDKDGVAVDGTYDTYSSPVWTNLKAWFLTQTSFYCGLHKDCVATYHYIKVVKNLRSE